MTNLLDAYRGAIDREQREERDRAARRLAREGGDYRRYVGRKAAGRMRAGRHVDAEIRRWCGL